MPGINEQRLRRIYAQLLSRNDTLIAQSKDKNALAADGSWNIYNNLIHEIVDMTGEKDFENYLVTPTNFGGIQHILAADFSGNVYQATRLMYDIYGEDLDIGDREPLSPIGSGENTPSHNINLTQTQSTEVRVEFNIMHQYVTERIVEAKAEYDEGTKERTFLDKVKEAVNLAKNTSDILVTIIQLAAKYGIAADDLAKMFN